MDNEVLYFHYTICFLSFGRASAEQEKDYTYQKGNNKHQENDTPHRKSRFNHEKSRKPSNNFPDSTRNIDWCQPINQEANYDW